MDLSQCFCMASHWFCWLHRSDDRWLMANQGKGKSRHSLSQLMRQVINIQDWVIIQSNTFLNDVVMNQNHSMFRICLPPIMGKDVCQGCDSVIYWNLFVIVHRGISMRPYGHTHGRLWMVQITGRFEIENHPKHDLASDQKIVQLEAVSPIFVHLKSQVTDTVHLTVIQQPAVCGNIVLSHILSNRLNLSLICFLYLH